MHTISVCVVLSGCDKFFFRMRFSTKNAHPLNNLHVAAQHTMLSEQPVLSANYADQHKVYGFLGSIL